MALHIPEAVHARCVDVGGDWTSNWIEKAIAKRLDEIPDRGMPVPPDRVKGGKDRCPINISTGLRDRLKFEAEDTEFTASRLALACILEALPAKPVTVSRVAAPAVRMDDIPRPRNRPYAMTKQAAVWLDRLNERLAMVEADAAMGRWAHYTITGGEIGVNRFEPLDAQGLRDFGEEVAQGRVVQEVIPWRYTEDEIAEWARGWNGRGKRLTWAFVGGDCESFMGAQEARRRSELRSKPEYTEALGALMEIEREEAIERAIFGREKMYLQLAAKDCVSLLRLAKRDGISVGRAVPKNLAYVVKAAAALGWEPPKEAGSVLRLGARALPATA